MPGLLPAPAAWRPIVKALHWIVMAALISVLAAGVTPATRYALAIPAAIWVGGFILFGTLGKPGPVLEGWVRDAFRPAHAALYLLVGAAAIAVFLAPPGEVAGLARGLTLAAFGAGSLHGVFHLWRHTTLGDGALRNMTPKILHDLL